MTAANAHSLEISGSPPAPLAADEPVLRAVFGTGRSGSTWLGALLNSHPDVAYRFEPFHRIKNNPCIREARAKVEAGTFTQSDIPTIYDALLTATPLTEKPPFFPKRFGRTFGRKLAWPLARRVGLARRVFEAMYTPPMGVPLIFKEVNLELLMIKFLEQTTTRVVYLVRHPGACVASFLAGQSAGLMPVRRFKLLPELLRTHDAALADRYESRVDSLSDCQRNALLWRIDIERAYAAVEGHSRAKIVAYEALCREPASITRATLEFFDIPYDEQVERFLQASTRPRPSHRFVRADIFANSYFSVFRDPSESMDRWRSKLSNEHKDEISEVVSDSAAFKAFAELGSWGEF